MSVLRNLESKLAGLVEGTFGRVFRSEVRPAELARRLTREMDEHRTVGLSRTYAPTEYDVYLSPPDRERLSGIEREVREELSGHLLEYARAEKLALSTTPRISFHTDERLGLGEFGIATRHAHEQEDQVAPDPPAGDGRTMVFSQAARVQEDLADARAARPGRAILAAEGKRFVLAASGAVIGRSRDCDVVLGDSNVSRRHARVQFGPDDGWTIEDLGSTNGVHVNGRQISGPATLQAGDRLDIGTVSARFEVD